MDFERNPQNVQMLRKINDFCRKECPIDCNTVIYQHKERIESDELNGDPNQLLIIIRLNLNPALNVEFNPKLTTLEYIIYIASGSSLWFGFVVFDCFQFINRHINIHRNKKLLKLTNLQVTVSNRISPKLYVLEHLNKLYRQ